MMHIQKTIALLFRYKKFSVSFAVLAMFYLAHAAFAAPDPATMDRYNLTGLQLHILSLAVAVPYVVIWLVAGAAYLWLHSYAQGLKGAKDGDAFAVISRGVFWLLLWMPLSSVFSIITAYLSQRHAGWYEPLTIIENYVNILILLPGFAYVYVGSKKLLATLRKHVDVYSGWLTAFYIAFSAFYVFITLSDTARQTPQGDMTHATYYLSDIWLVLTIIIPRLITWFLGLQAVRNVLLYRRHVKGNIYRAALNDLAFGIGGVLVFVIALRCIQSLSLALASLSLGLLLLLVYALLAMIAVSFVYVARGANRLRRIEEL